MKFKKRGQVWIETVLYTLIAFVIIGMVLSFVRPKIQEMQDKVIIVQSIEVMERINSVITDVAIGGAGNKRTIQIKIQKGDLTIDSVNERIYFEIESRHQYSKLDTPVQIGNVNAKTEEKGSKLYLINLTMDYSNKYDLTYSGYSNEPKTITKSPAIYKLFISNEGDKKINFDVG